MAGHPPSSSPWVTNPTEPSEAGAWGARGGERYPSLAAAPKSPRFAPPASKPSPLAPDVSATVSSSYAGFFASPRGGPVEEWRFEKAAIG